MVLIRFLVAKLLISACFVPAEKIKVSLVSSMGVNKFLVLLAESKSTAGPDMRYGQVAGIDLAPNH